MSTVSPVTSSFYVEHRSAGVVDSDGDQDGSKPREVEAVEASSPKPPTPPKPTETTGNHVNTYA